jgi:hypothetical protein
MLPETETIFRVLESYNSYSLNKPFLWDSKQRGKFNIWKFLISEGFVRSDDRANKIEQAIQQWRAIEFRGAVTTQDKSHQYAPDWKERTGRVTPYKMKERTNVYKALTYFIKQNLQNLEVHILSDYHGYTEHNFEVYIILGQTIDHDWVCLLPTVPSECGLWYTDALRVNVQALTSCKSENLNTQNFFEKVNKVLARLEPLIIYQYYENYYEHRIVCATSANKIKAIKLGLQASRMFAVDGLLSEINRYSNNEEGEEVRQFMQESLQDCRCYTFSFWESGWIYELGHTQTGDWLGFKHWCWSDYNP